MSTQQATSSQSEPIIADDLEASRLAAQGFERAHKLDDAIASWRRVESLAAEDAEASRMIATLTVFQSRVQAGLEVIVGAGDEEQCRKSKVESRKSAADRLAIPSTFIVPPADVPGGLSLTPIQQLEAAIRQ